MFANVTFHGRYASNVQTVKTSIYALNASLLVSSIKIIRKHTGTALHLVSDKEKFECRYRVIGDLSFPVFSSSWGADEELLFFDGICSYGIDNWEAVSHFVGSKSPDACKAHYAEVCSSLLFKPNISL